MEPSLLLRRNAEDQILVRFPETCPEDDKAV